MAMSLAFLMGLERRRKKDQMGNKLLPQKMTNPKVKSSVLPKEPRHNLSTNCFCFCFRWMMDWWYTREKVTAWCTLPNIIANSDFSVGTLEHWSCNANCDGVVIVNDSPYPKSKRETYAFVSNRNKYYSGLQQEINVSPNVTYFLHARVGVLGLSADNTAKVEAKLILESEGSTDCVLNILLARVDATSNAWANLEGHFELKHEYNCVCLYFEVVDADVNLIVSRVDLRPLPA